MNATIVKKAPIIRGCVKLPASKSISNRALIINALSGSGLPLGNLAQSEDVDYMLNALNSNTNVFYTGDGGTTIRFLTAFLARIVGEWTVNCSPRMEERPIKVLVDALNQLGAQISYLKKEGYPPLKILGSNMTQREISLSGQISSQYISALLLIAPTLPNGLKLTLEGKIVSRSYIEMTLNVMRDFGVQAIFEENTIEIAPQEYQIKPYTVEADWSAASYWYQMLCMAEDGEIRLEGLRADSYQGDRKQVELWRQLGVATQFVEGGVLLTKAPTEINDLKQDFLLMPDLAQTFAVCCAMKNIPFHFSGLETLKIKESNRVEALICELAKLGKVLEEKSQGTLSFTGETRPQAKKVSIATYRDHRMAMAFAPIALLTPLTVENKEVVGKSYPQYWEHLSQLGFELTES